MALRPARGPATGPARGRWLRRAREELRDPVRYTELLQLLKTAAAAVLAWVVASRVAGLPQAFLAPWAALLVVHSTVYRTLAQGVRQVSAAVLGVLLAWVVGETLGLSTLAVSALLVAGMLLGAARWFRGDTTSVAATGIVVLLTGVSGQHTVLVDRLFDTAIGIAVGLAVNLLVWPPLRDYAAAQAIDGIDDEVGELLRDMARGLRTPCTVEDAVGWVERTRDIDDAMDRAWSMLRQARESSRFNPRRAAVGLRRGADYEEILRDDEQAVAEVRSMARTIGHGIDMVVTWEPAFRGPWLDLLAEAGEAIGAPDSLRLVQVRGELDRLADRLSTADLPARHWPEYGALLMNLRNVVSAMDRVAEQAPVVVPRYERRRARLRRR